MKSFTLSHTPYTFFAKGALQHVYHILKNENCKSLLIVTGGKSFIETPHYDSLREGLKAAGIRVSEAKVTHEPSPELVDEITLTARKVGVEAVLAIGGGSVLDAGKAISAMFKVPGSVKDYLEGVGTLAHDGSKIPLIAVPTTSGTGSEATKNAVLSKVGANGFKKSLRHDRFVPDYAVLDPELSLTCPIPVTAASGMDALNQLLEGYLSVNANPFTDALAISGIQKIFSALEPLCLERPGDIGLRGEMAYAAYLSGIVLANAGLGYVHGFAGVIGGLADIPHGVVCGKLNAGVFECLAQRVMNDREAHTETYKKLITLSNLIGADADQDVIKIQTVIDRLYHMEERLQLPGFESYDIGRELIKKAVSMTSGKESPVKLSQEELYRIAAGKL